MEIEFVDENIQSYKKLIYALEAYGDHHIATCDDDAMYHHWFLQGLYRSWQQHPDCISAYRGRMMGKIDAQQLFPYSHWAFLATQTPSHNVFPTGSGGIWYPPNSLDARVTDRSFMALAPSGDDIWFKAMALLNQTKAVMVKQKSIDFPAINIQPKRFLPSRNKYHHAETLWQKNHQENDSQVKAVFDHFDLYRMLS